VVHEKVLLTGADVNNAGVGFDRNNLPYVSLEFKPQGARVFCTVTTENVGKPFAIVLDGEVKSAPNIKERICGGGASIEMGGAADPLQEAETLALVLRTGSLDAPVTVAEIRTVGASLGEDAINAGILATIIGSILVITFMAVWYNVSGLLADAALIVSVLVQLATLSLFGATLTLPGIAGIALTIGMTVDANIIIFERIREELALGQHARKAVEAGYDKAFSAILDGNVTTAIAGVVLYSYGTGPIKGFAVTLLVGIGTTLLTALFVSRTFLELMTRNSAARLRI
jgi:preprotein translocase subunit SecD